MTAVTIARADRAQLFRVTTTVTRSFFPLDVAHWLVPDPEERWFALRAHILLGVQQAFAHGHIDVAETGAAAAVWLRLPATPSPDYERKLRHACGEYADRFLLLDKLFEQHYPVDTECMVLEFLATDPEHQNRKLGTALLRRQHRLLDEQGMSAFLVASCERSRRLYEREGYSLVEDITLPSGPVMFAMIRSPQPLPQAV